MAVVRVLRVMNWRCVESLEVDLSHVTLFIGRNAAGKSSLAYAAYFVSRLARVGDADRLLRHLYGTTIDGVVRTDGRGVKYYPLVVEAAGARFEARSPTELEAPKNSPWSDELLLPSQRLGFIRLLKTLQELWSSVSRSSRPGKTSEARFAGMLVWVLLESLKDLPLQPPMFLFLDDFMKLSLGRRLAERIPVGSVGEFVREVVPVLSLLVYDYIDPYTKLRLPSSLAPDGAVDSLLLREFIDRAPEGSLVVVEEPEIHKNPLTVVELARELAVKAVERRLTLVVTTHSDLLLQAIAKTVEQGRLKPDQVAIYYLERSREHPWTKARRLHVYEDGTVEELPDVEKVVSLLF